METKSNASTPIQNNWNEQKVKLKQKFNNLTDHDLHFEEGQKQVMMEKLQTKLGKTEEELKLIIERL